MPPATLADLGRDTNQTVTVTVDLPVNCTFDAALDAVKDADARARVQVYELFEAATATPDSRIGQYNATRQSEQQAEWTQEKQDRAEAFADLGVANNDPEFIKAIADGLVSIYGASYGPHYDTVNIVLGLIAEQQSTACASPQPPRS